MVRQYSVNIPELHVLDIIGTEETSILRLNQTELVSKGSRDYILSVREAVLSNRDYIIPADWDTEWNVHLGPIWTPERLDSTELLCWLPPEYLHELDTDDTKVAEAEDRSGNGNTFYNTYLEANLPTFSSELNGFKGMDFDGAGDCLYEQSESDDFDVGTDDFYFMLMVEHGTDTNSEDYILCSDSFRDFALSARSNNTNFTYNFYINGSSIETNPANLAWSSEIPGIIGTGRISGVRTIHKNGNDTNLISGTDTSSISNTQQMFLGGKEGFIDGSAGNTWNGTMYEMIFYKGTLSLENREKLEGYLAHKYAQTDILPTSHPYKSNPPRSQLQE